MKIRIIAERTISDPIVAEAVQKLIEKVDEYDRCAEAQSRRIEQLAAENTRLTQQLDTARADSQLLAELGLAYMQEHGELSDEVKRLRNILRETRNSRDATSAALRNAIETNTQLTKKIGRIAAELQLTADYIDAEYIRGRIKQIAQQIANGTFPQGEG